MYAAIRRGTLPAHVINTFIKRATDTFAPVLTALPGFVDYYIVHVGTEVVVSVSIFETQETAQSSNAAFATWAREQQILPQFQGPLELMEGEIVFHPGKQEQQLS
jgi:heme-degrading monooxygenase HmoA